MARSVFHHFPITRTLVSVKCRQFSVLVFTRGSLEAPVLPLNYARSRANELIVHNKETRRTERLNVARPLFRDLARDWPQNSHGTRYPRREPW
jgi:hypothetical protein